MLRITLVEQPAPAGMHDVDHLIAWILDSLGLVRRRNEADSSKATERPLHRLMRDHLLGQPETGYDTKTLAAELSISLTALHHHLGGLQSARIVASEAGDEGWKMHHLRCNSLPAALNLLHTEVCGILKLRLNLLSQLQSGRPEPIQAGEQAPVPLKISVVEPHPLDDSEDVVDSLMNDLGLRGQRPRASGADDLPRMVFEALLQSDHPLSLDEGVSRWGATRPRLTRTFERFRQAGLAVRCLRTDRLSVILWDALSSQYARRGEDWLMGKGGLGRLDEKTAGKVVVSLRDGTFTTEVCDELFSEVSLDEKLVAINLLGGRLPYGYQLCGRGGEEITRNVVERVDSLFRRMVGVAERLEEMIREGRVK